MSLLEISHLTTKFETQQGTVSAVRDVSYHLEEGEVLGIVGESGSGKSVGMLTLMGLLASNGRVEEGEILFDGENISPPHTKDRKEKRAYEKKMQQIRGNRIGMIFQDPMACLNPRQKVADIIAQGLDIHHRYHSQKERTEMVADILHKVGLAPEHANRYPHQFSGGQRQRVGIARALVMNPKLIIADECISALDMSIQAQVVNLMKDIQDETGLAYLFIAHDLSVMRYISDRIAVIHKGRIVELAEAEELFLHPLHPYTKALLSAIPIPKAHLNRERIILEGDITSPVNPPAGCRFASRCWKCKEICKQQSPELRKVGNSVVACHFAEED